MLNCLEMTFKLRFDSCVTAVEIVRNKFSNSDLTQFHTPEISIDSGWKHSKIIPHSRGSCAEKHSINMDCYNFICQSYRFCDINPRGCFHPAAHNTCTAHRGFDFLTSSLILMIMDNGKWLYGSPEMQGSQPKPERNENWKMYTINQIKICAECWDIVPKALADLSGTPGLNDSKITNLPWPWVPVPVFCSYFQFYIKQKLRWLYQWAYLSGTLRWLIYGSVAQHTSWLRSKVVMCFGANKRARYHKNISSI